MRLHLVENRGCGFTSEVLCNTVSLGGCRLYARANWFYVCFTHGPGGHGVHQCSLYARGVYVSSVLWWLRQKCTLYRVDVLSCDDEDDNVDGIRGTIGV